MLLEQLKMKEYWSKFLAQAQHSGDRRCEANAELHLAWLCLQMSDAAGTQGHSRAALHIFDVLGLPSGAASADLLISHSHLLLGDADAARHWVTRALEICRSIDSDPGLGEALLQLSTVERSAGNPALACEHCTDALALYARCGGRLDRIRALRILGAARVNL